MAQIVRDRTDVAERLDLTALTIGEALSTGVSVSTVSVQRTWSNRLVDRLNRRHTSNSTEQGIGFIFGALDSEESQLAPMLTTPKNAVRSSNDWTTGLNQPFRSSVLTRLLSRLAKTQVHLVRVNAFSLARFDFDRDALLRTRFNKKVASGSESSRARVPTSARFLMRLEQERGARFAGAPGMLSDRLRIGFISIYRKSAAVLAQLLANSLARLPRNRKEIPFIRFRRKLVKVLASARPERLGVRVSFKGRVARWNRTKILSGENGRLSLYTYSTRLESGRAQAITRKGTRGVRVWLSYHPSFAKRFRPTLLAFLRSGA